ncbi:hypothetical protein ACFW7J_26835 [Streptomyces sp. NPDC059525]|uniref:AMP-binding enzyme n=1 Tax=Streptomyces sp. NPDC059525 TaxID=3346857 RepID=UPI00369D2726
MTHESRGTRTGRTHRYRWWAGARPGSAPRHDTITVDGTQVYPSEIEEVLTAHPAVAECAVFGMRHDDAFEHVHAAIVPARGHSADIDELRRLVAARKGGPHVPHTFHVLKAIPLSGIGKPDKHALRRALS